MSTLFPVHGKLLQPSAVDLVVVARFIDGREAPQLITAHANILRIYRLHHRHGSNHDEDFNQEFQQQKQQQDQLLFFADDGRPLRGQLSLVGEYRLNGHVVDLAVLPNTSGTNRADFLFLSFSDAKVA